MANSQDIEARLCAYIDGVLTDSQRADIERHLADHPQHRQLIQDLVRTRQLVTALPRVKAPADLGEGLQGQLERSMLLGDQVQAPEPWSLASGRVHKVAIFAAVMALSLGLGSVIFMLLRAAAHPAHMEAMVAAATQPAIVAAPATQPVVAVEPDTQPSPATVADATAAGPATQPDAVADMVATTQPVEAAAEDLLEGNMLDFDDATPATQPSTQPSTQPAAAIGTADPTTQPAVSTTAAAATTMPVADNAADK